MKKTILVIGLQGTKDERLFRSSSSGATDFAIRGFVRDRRSEAATRLAKLGVELVQGDLDSMSTLERR